MKYSEINKSFKKYKLSKKKESMTKICKPTQFKLQPQQLFLRDLFKTKKIKGLLVYHKIGAGKTCTAISIAEEFKKKMNIIVVLPAALIGNFEDELRSKCGNNNYISGDESYDLKNLSVKSKKYKKVIKRSKKKIKKFYKIYSYHKFIDLINNSKIRLKNTLLIVDEIQNMISESGIFYQKLREINC